MKAAMRLGIEISSLCGYRSQKKRQLELQLPNRKLFRDRLRSLPTALIPLPASLGLSYFLPPMPCASSAGMIFLHCEQWDNLRP